MFFFISLYSYMGSPRLSVWVLFIFLSVLLSPLFCYSNHLYLHIPVQFIAVTFYLGISTLFNYLMLCSIIAHFCDFVYLSDNAEVAVNVILGKAPTNTWLSCMEQDHWITLLQVAMLPTCSHGRLIKKSCKMCAIVRQQVWREECL